MLGRVIGTGSKSFFPAGYKLITSGTFPGFDGIRIPISASASASGYTGDGTSCSGSSYVTYLDNTYTYLLNASGSHGGGWQLRCNASASKVDLMGLCYYDWEKLKKIKSITGGTVITWLEKVGG